MTSSSECHLKNITSYLYMFIDGSVEALELSKKGLFTVQKGLLTYEIN